MTYEAIIAESLDTCQRLLRELEAKRKAGMLSPEQQGELARLTQERIILQELLAAPVERDSA